MSSARLKGDWTSWRDKPYATGDDKKRQVAEVFAEIAEYCRRRGGAVTSPPGRYVTIECPRGSALPEELARLGFNIVDRGFTTRIVGADYVSPRAERLLGVAPPSPFQEMGVYEVTLGGKK